MEISVDGRDRQERAHAHRRHRVENGQPSAYRGFLATENDQGLVGERLELPNAADRCPTGGSSSSADTRSRSPAPYDAPHDFHFGAVARYQDGQHFARFVIDPDLNQGPDPVKAITNGDSRFTYVLTIDARIEKGFYAGRTRLAGVLEGLQPPGHWHRGGRGRDLGPVLPGDLGRAASARAEAGPPFRLLIRAGVCPADALRSAQAARHVELREDARVPVKYASPAGVVLNWVHRIHSPRGRAGSSSSRAAAAARPDPGGRRSRGRCRAGRPTGALPSALQAAGRSSSFGPGTGRGGAAPATG